MTNRLIGFLAIVFLLGSCTKPTKEKFNTNNIFVNISPLIQSDITSGWFFNEYSGMLSTDRGDIVTTNNSGVEWDSSRIANTSFADNLVFLNDNFGFCTTDSNKTFKYSSGEWEEFNFPINNTLPSSIQILNEQIQFASTLRGENNEAYIVKTSNGGQTWDTIYSTDSDIQQIYMIDELLGFFITNEPNKVGLYKTMDGGNSWYSRLPSAYGEHYLGTAKLIKILAIDQDNLIIIGRGEKSDEGMVLVSNNAGDNWSLGFVNNALNDVYATNNSVFFVGDELFVASWLISLANMNSAYNITDNWMVFDRATRFVLSKAGTPLEYYGDIKQVQFVNELNGFIISEKPSQVFKITFDDDTYDKN